MAAKKWEMAATVASHLVKTEPETSGWWINLAYATRRCEGIEKAEAILLRARELHHDNAMIEFNLADIALSRPLRAVPTEKQNPPACLVNVAGFRERIWQGRSLRPSAGSERSICPNP